MKTMWISLLIAASLLLGPATGHALEAGKDYEPVSPPQRASVNPGQIEVLEFFWYRCPHCFSLEPGLNEWARKQPRDVVVKRVPALLGPSWAPMARAYYALEALGLTEQLHGDVFNAIHVQGMDLNPPDSFLDWAATKGVDRQKLAEAYNSFATNTKVLRAQQLTRDYKLNGVPAIAIHGKHLTNVALTGSEPALFKTVDALIDLERKGNPRGGR